MRNVIKNRWSMKTTYGLNVVLVMALLLFGAPWMRAAQSVYTTPGASTWTCPAGVNYVMVECWGGGGAGGNAKVTSGSGSCYGSGAAGGAYARKLITVTPGNTYTVTVGSGAIAVTGTANGGNGGDSWFSSSSTVFAKGGTGGNSAEAAAGTTTAAVPAPSASSSIGDAVYIGGQGNTGNASGGGGGGGAGSGGNGGNGGATGGNPGAGAAGAAGAVGSDTTLAGGAGGAGGASGSNAGSTGSAPGGAGGGASANSSTEKLGGNGAAGKVVVTTYSSSLIARANTSGALNTAGDWVGGVVPGSQSVARWDSTVATAANCSAALGADTSWAGINIVNPNTTVTITSGNTLTLGLRGINMASASQNLTLQCGLQLPTSGGGWQQWYVPSGRTLDASGVTIGRSKGDTLDFTTGGTIKIGNTLANNIVGCWATVGGAAWAAGAAGNAVSAFSTYNNTFSANGSTAFSSTAGDNDACTTASGSTTIKTLTATTFDLNSFVLSGAGNFSSSGVSGSVLRFGSLGGVLVTSGAGTLTIGGGGSLTAGGAANTAGELFIVNNSANPMLVNAVNITDNGSGAVTVNKGGSGVLDILTSTSFTGGFYLNAGGVAMNTATPFGNTTSSKLTINGGYIRTHNTTARAISNPVDLAGDLQLGDSSGSYGALTFQTGAWVIKNGTRTITASADTFTHIISSVIGDGGNAFGITKAGSGILQLNNTETYTGPTTVSAGTLQLGSSGALANNSSVSIAAGGTFDVTLKAASGGTYTWNTTSLSASGTGTTAGTTAATITGTAGATVSMGSKPINLTWSGATSGTDSTHPPLTVSGAALSLGGNTFTIVTSSALGAGTYTLVSAASIAGGSTVNSTPSFTGGSGLQSGYSGVVSISGSTVILTVSPTCSNPSASLAFSADSASFCSGSSATLTISGVQNNGAPANATYSYQLYVGGAPGVGAAVGSPQNGNGGNLTWSVSSAGTYSVYCTGDGSVVCSGPTKVNASDVVITVNPLPTITLGGNPSVNYSPSSQTASLTYSATTQSPDQYSIVWDSTGSDAVSAGFANVTLASLSASPIGLGVPAGVAPGTYNGTLTVTKSSTGCTSSGSAISVAVIKANPTIAFNLGTSVVKTADDGSFSDSATSGGSSSPVTYSSDNTSVATVDSSGLVTVVGLAGTAHILANQAGDANYNAAPQISQTLTINPGAIASYVVAAPSTAAKGVDFNATVTAKDSHNNTVTTDSSTVVTMSSSGSVQFDSNGDSTFGDNTKTLANGTFAIAAKDDTAETVTVTATDAGSKTGTSGNIVVKDQKYLITLPGETFTDGSGNSGTVSAQTAGTQFTIELRVVDQNYNVDTSVNDTGVTVSFTGPGNAPNAAAPVYTTTVDFTAGVATTTLNTTLKKAETTTLTATSVSVPAGFASSSLTVNPAALDADVSTVSANPSTQTTDFGATSTITVTAKDSFGNTIPGKTVTISATGTGNTMVQPAAVTDASGQATGTIASTVAEVKTVSANIDSTAITQTANVTFTPGALDHFAITPTISSPQVAGVAITGLTITAQDMNNNTVTSFAGTDTYSGTAGVTGTSGSFTSGQLTSVSITPTVAGSSMTFVVTGAGKTGTATFDVNPAALDHFGISTISSPQTAGTPVTGITITAQDAFNNTIPSFTSTVTYGGTAGVTGTSDSFTAGQLTGVSITPTVSGTGKTFTVSASGKTGTATFNVDSAALDHFNIAAIGNQYATLPFNITITAQDTYNNTVTSFSGTVDLTTATGTITPTPSGAFTSGTRTESVTLTGVTASQAITATKTGGSETGTSGTFSLGNLPKYQTRTGITTVNWEGAATWQRDDGLGGAFADTTSYPTATTADTIEIRSGTVTVAVSEVVDQVTVNNGATLSVSASQTLTVVNGSGTDLDVKGTLSNAGTILQVNAAGSGSITTTSGSAVVTGTGTTFTSLAVGDLLYAGTTLLGTIKTVDSGSQVTLFANAAAVVTGSSWYFANTSTSGAGTISAGTSGTGTISTASSSATVTGTGTTFISSGIAVGNTLYSGSTSLGTVKSIDSDTQITLLANASSVVSGTAWSYVTPVITGTGTSFTSGLTVGNQIYTTGAGAVLLGTVKSIDSASQITLNANASAPVSGATWNYVDNQSTIGSVAFESTANGGPGIYQHNRDGGGLPIATWGDNSSCSIIGVTSTAITTLNSIAGQSADNNGFYDFTMNSPAFNVSGGTWPPAKVRGTLTATIPTSKTWNCYYNAFVTLNWGNLVLNGAGTVTLFNSGSSVSTIVYNIPGNVTITSGTLALGGSATTANITINVGGNWSNSGTFSPTTGSSVTNVFNGVSQSISGSTTTAFKSVNVATASTVTLTTGFTATSAASVDGTLVCGSSSTVGGAGTFTLNLGGTLKSANATGISGSITASGAKTYNGLVVLNGTVAQNAGTGYSSSTSLEIANTVQTVSLSAATSVKNLTIDASTTLDATSANNYALNVAGNWANSGTFTPRSGTVTFNGSSGTQSVSGTTTFNNLTLANTGATTDFGSSSISIANTFSKTAGTMAGGTSSFTFTGLAGSIIGGSAKEFYDLTINGGASITAATTSGNNITIKHNYSNAGTFAQDAARSITFDNTGAHALSGVGTTTFGSVTVSGGGTLNAGSHSFTIGGSSFQVSSGGVFNGNAGTVTFSTTTSLSGSGAFNWNNIAIGSSGVLTPLAGTASVNALSIAGFNKVAGTWGASGAAHNDATHFGGTGLLNVSSGPTSSTTVAADVNPSIYGNSVTFTATVTGSGGTLPVTGTVTFMDGATTLGTGTLSGSPTATASYAATASQLLAGTHGTIIAVYGGSDNFAGSTSANLSQTVNPLPVVLSGARVYDGTTTASYAILSVANKVGVDDVSLASGNATLASANGGLQTVSDASGLSLGGAAASNYTLTGASGSVRINPAPGSFTITTTMNTAATFPTSKLVNHASDAGVTLSVTAVSSPSVQNGTVQLNGNNITYTPATGSTAPDSFTYTLSDGVGGSSLGTVNVTVNSANVGPSLTPQNNGSGYGTFTASGLPDTMYDVQVSTSINGSWDSANNATVTSAHNGVILYTDTETIDDYGGTVFYRLKQH